MANVGVVGKVAHGGVAEGNPVRVCGTSETANDTQPGTQVSADGMATTLTTDKAGALYTLPHPPRIWHTANEFTTQQTDTIIKAAPGAGLTLCITDIMLSCNGAVTVTLEEGTTVLKFRHYANAQGSNVAKTFRVPIILAANTALTVTTSALVTVALTVCGHTTPT